MRSGHVTSVFWTGDEAAARVLAEEAALAGPFPGLSSDTSEPVTLLLADTDARFDSLVSMESPDWIMGVAFPASNTIVLRLVGDVRRTVRHEMAHLALHRVVERVPSWFDEGYASRAAGEWGRLEALRANWALMTGTVPTLSQVNRDIRGGPANAGAAYALATAAVVFLERLGGEQGLGMLMANLVEQQDFDRALRATHHVTMGQFEVLWQRDLRKRYGWVLFFSSLTVFWAIIAIILVSLRGIRRSHDRARKAALDRGWVVPMDEWD